MASTPIIFKGHGANIVGSLGSGSLVQDMPSAVFFDESEDDNYVMFQMTLL